MAGKKERVDAYLDTISRIEPEIAMLDQGAALASIAISLKRIADSTEKIAKCVSGQNYFKSLPRTS